MSIITWADDTNFYSNPLLTFLNYKEGDKQLIMDLKSFQLLIWKISTI
jgi:hypothetical protein